MDILKTIAIGIIIGVSNVIPGVSGGTMAVIFNIYDKLIGALSLDFKMIKKHFRFYVLLAAGIGIGIILFSKAINFLLQNFTFPTIYFFMGIVIGSIPMLWSRASAGGIALKNTATGFAMLALMAVMFFISPGESSAVVSQLTPSVFAYMVFAGAIASFTMIIPGISGSFILLAIGAYMSVITAVSEFNLAILLPVAIGAAIGLLGGAKLVKFLMERYTQATYMGILGLVIGSLFTLYPGFTADIWGIISILSFAAGAATAYFGGKSA